MSPKPTQPDDTASFIEHFEALPFDQQRTVLTACQAAMEKAVQERIAALDAERAELMALTGRPDASAPSYAGEQAGKTRGPVAVKYYDPETGDRSTGRGSPAKWLKAKQDAGEDIAKYLVGPENPLPANLQ